MRDTQVSRPVLIALIGAILVGGFLFYKSQSSEEVAPPPPVTEQPAPTGATGDSATGATGKDGATGQTGSTGKKLTAAERRAKRRAARRKKLIAEAEAKGMPLTVYKGLKANKVVLIFFWTPDATTDQHVNQAVKELKSRHGDKLVVVKEKISNKSRYQGIAKVTEITQTPGIVMIYGTAADAWQGYIDGGALNVRYEHLLAMG
jgi:hypothetical protein